MPFQNTKYIYPLVCFIFASSCGKKHSDSLPVGLAESVNGGHPPAYVQKAWDSRYTYDPDRRLLIPKYAGSRWGAVQQYKEEGQLEYQDWWIRDIRTEELESAPVTKITSLINEDGNLTSIFKLIDDDSNASVEKSALDSEVENTEDPFSGESSLDEDDAFEPSPFSPF